MNAKSSTHWLAALVAVAVALLLFTRHAYAANPTIDTCLQSGLTNSLAPWYCSQINQAAASIWYTWQPYALLVALITFLLATVIFLIGVVLKNSRIRNFGIGEFYEAIATVLIAALFLTLSATMFGILPSLTTGQINPYETATSYIGSEITATSTLMHGLFNPYVIDYFYTSMSLKICLSGEECTQPVVPQLAAALTIFVLMPSNAVFSLLTDGLLALYAQMYMLLLFMYAAIPVFLIPGVVFRAIIPTRNLGGMMIAIAIGFYFIMPILYSIAFYFTSGGVLQMLNTANAAAQSSGVGTGAQTNGVSATSPLAVAISGVQSGMGSFWISVLFYPGLIIAMTYESIRVIAEFIGGAAKTSSRLKSL